MKILVTGSAGQLGAAAVRGFRTAGHDVVATTRRDLDVTDHRAVLEAVGRARPDAVVNCVGFNDVDGAEDHHITAFEVNAFSVRSLARAVVATDAVLVHYGTDFVFDGETTTPYSETDTPRPRSVYAASKLTGEWFAADAPRHFVLRVESLFGGPAARSSVDRIIDAIDEGREVRLFADRVVSPSYVDDVVRATEQLLVRGAPPGLYHCVNAGYATWEALGRELARLAGREDALLRPVPVASVPLRAPRPRFAALSIQKLAALGIDMPAWQDALERYLAVRRRRRPPA